MSDTTDSDDLTRRRTLGLGGSIIAARLAGCAGGDSGGGDETEAATDTATPTETATPTDTEAPETEAASLEPLSVPEDASCAVCNMKPAKFADYNAQAQYESADPKFFCSNGCLAAFVADPGHFAESHAGATIAAAFVHDHDTTEWIDAQEATYVLEMNSDRVDDPMRINPLAFDTRSDATAYVEEYDDLTEADLAGFADFDRDLAEQYRGSFFE